MFLWLQDGFSALMWASQQGHGTVVNLLLEHGAQVNLEDEVSHSYPADSFFVDRLPICDDFNLSSLNCTTLNIVLNVCFFAAE